MMLVTMSGYDDFKAKLLTAGDLRMGDLYVTGVCRVGTKGLHKDEDLLIYHVCADEEINLGIRPM
ncbi:hypothetical protein DJICPGNB_25885 [Escherichia coli]|nr:hypothetical protein DJICPGNB_25885 [Escherichia coli]